MYFLLMSVITLTVAGSFSYVISVSTLRKNANTGMANTVEQIGRNVENQIEKINRYAYLLFTDVKIQQTLMEHSLPNHDPGRLYSLYKELDSILSYYFYNDKYFLSASITLNSGERYIYQSSIADYPISPLLDQLDQVMESKQFADGAVRWEGPARLTVRGGRQVELFSVSRELKNVGDMKTSSVFTIGQLRLVFSEKMYSDLYQSIHTDANSVIMIVDAAGNVISHKEKSFVANSMAEEDFMNKVLNSHDKVFVHSHDGTRSFVSSYKLGVQEWRVIELVPYTYVTTKINSILLITILMCLVCLLGIYLLSLFLSVRFSKPLMELNWAMKEMEKGNFDISVDVSTKDEVGQMKNHFNRMVKRIKGLFERTIKQEREKQEQELRALQYQVNPHFLYNTLNSVRLMAILSKANHVAAMIEALIRLLRNTLGKYGKMVSVKVEIDNIRDFIFIQNMRYSGKFEVDYQIDNNLLSLLMPHFILQPLVENALFHGLEPKRGMEKGKLTVHGKLSGEQLAFCLTDNGVGMTSEQIERIFAGIDHEFGYTQIGIKNVHDRIRLMYGPDYGIRVDSVIGEGTTVEVRLPIIRQQREGENESYAEDDDCG
jgi:two-component system sensor histidine kinase YesM